MPDPRRFASEFRQYFLGWDTRGSEFTELGANRHYSGIGKTKIYRNAPKKRRYRSQISGSTEFFTFERDPLTIEQLGPEAISYQPLTPIKELHG